MLPVARVLWLSLFPENIVSRMSAWGRISSFATGRVRPEADDLSYYLFHASKDRTAAGKGGLAGRGGLNVSYNKDSAWLLP
jgi:hypothetical protein